MYDFEIHTTGNGLEVDVKLPNPPKVILGVKFEVAASTLTFSPEEIADNKMHGLPFSDAVQRSDFQEAVREATEKFKNNTPSLECV